MPNWIYIKYECINVLFYSFEQKFIVVVFLAKHNEMTTVLVCGGRIAVTPATVLSSPHQVLHCTAPLGYNSGFKPDYNNQTITVTLWLMGFSIFRLDVCYWIICMDSFTAQNVDLSLVFCFPPFPGPVASYTQAGLGAKWQRNIVGSPRVWPLVRLQRGIATLVTLDTDKNFN